MNKVLLILPILLIQLSAMAQLFPVEINGNLFFQSNGRFDQLPYELHQKGNLSIILLDNTVSNYDIQLEVKISGWALQISKNTLTSPFFTLNPFIPRDIESSDWVVLLDENNLQISGSDMNRFFQSGFLPPGNYELCVTAHDAHHPNQPVVSNEFCMTISVNSEPSPECMLPFCGDTISAQIPIQFTWADLSQNPTMEYTLQIFERRYPQLPMITEINQSPPVFEHTTTDINYVYSASDLPLQEGMSYIWRIKKQDYSGQYQLDNGGYSLPCSFAYGVNQLLTASNLQLTGSVINSRQVRYQWNMIGNFHHYEFQLRAANSSTWNSFTQNSSIRNEYNLEPSTAYIARVRGVLGQETGAWSNEVSISTPASPVIGCNDDFIIPPSHNFAPLLHLLPGEKISAGQFEIVTSSVHPNGIPGKFTGQGQTLMFGFLSIPVEFQQATFSEERTLVNGVVYAKTTYLTSGGSSSQSDPWQTNHHNYSGSIDTIITGAGGLILIIDANGDTTTADYTYTSGNTVITDQDGFSWLVLENGIVIYLSPSVLHIIQQAVEEELEANNEETIDGLNMDLQTGEQNLTSTLSRLPDPSNENRNLSVISHWEEINEPASPLGKHSFKEKENQYNYSLFSNRFCTRHLCPEGIIFLAQWLTIENQNAAWFIEQGLVSEIDEEELISKTREGLIKFLKAILTD